MPINGGSEQFKYIDLNPEQNRTGIFSIRFSPCGSSIIGGCNNSCVYIADRETQNVSAVRTQRGLSSVDINAVCYAADNDSNVFLSGCNNGMLKMWDIRCLSTGRGGRNIPVGTFLGHLDGITYIDARNDGHHVLTNSKDQTIRLWDLRKTTPTNKINKYSYAPMLDWDYRWDSVPRECKFSIIANKIHNKYLNISIDYNPNQPLDGDVSIMTYRGHRVTKSLLRAKFSPLAQTGQRYIYTGCATGRIISKSVYIFI